MSAGRQSPGHVPRAMTLPLPSWQAGGCNLIAPYDCSISDVVASFLQCSGWACWVFLELFHSELSVSKPNLPLRTWGREPLSKTPALCQTQGAMWQSLEFRAGGPTPALPLRASTRPFSPVAAEADRPWGAASSGPWFPLLSPRIFRLKHP